MSSTIDPNFAVTSSIPSIGFLHTRENWEMVLKISTHFSTRLINISILPKITVSSRENSSHALPELVIAVLFFVTFEKECCFGRYRMTVTITVRVKEG